MATTGTNTDTAATSASANANGTHPTPTQERPQRRPPVIRTLARHEYKAAAATLAAAFAHDAVARYFYDTPARAHWSAADKWRLHVEILEYLVDAHLLRGVVTCCDDVAADAGAGASADVSSGADGGANGADSNPAAELERHSTWRDGGGDAAPLAARSDGPSDGRYACVALWMPPGAHMDDTLTLLRSGLWRLHYKLCSEGRARFFTEFFPLLHDTKAAVLGDRDADAYYLVYVGTRPGAQGRGLARALVADMLRKADAEGRAAYLESSNVVNERFYASLGFERRRVIAMTGHGPGKEVRMTIMVREPRGRAVESAGCAAEGETATVDDQSAASNGERAGADDGRAEEQTVETRADTAKSVSTAKSAPKLELRASAEAGPRADGAKRSATSVKAYAVVKTDDAAGMVVARN